MAGTLSLTSTVRLSSGHYMPLLGFGVYQNYDAKPSVLEAFKAGYRHVDSAQVYRNEAAVGAAVKESGLKREDLFITTKCVSKTHGYESTLKGVDTSLDKFGIDYIDLFVSWRITSLVATYENGLHKLIHDPYSGTERRLATYKALLEAKTAGKIRSIGVSNYGVHHLEELKAAKLEMPAVNQIELHPLCQQKPIVKYCNEHSIVVQAYCPLVRGKMDMDILTKIAAKHNKDPAHVLLRWSLQKGFVPLPKSATPSRIHSNAQLYDFELDAEDMSNLDDLDGGNEGAISWNPVEAP